MHSDPFSIKITLDAQMLDHPSPLPEPLIMPVQPSNSPVNHHVNPYVS